MYWCSKCGMSTDDLRFVMIHERNSRHHMCGLVCTHGRDVARTGLVARLGMRLHAALGLGW